jgi:hypothetical protein
MDTQQDSQSLLDVGIWLGRKQAFSAVAGRCSAADAECLRKIHENKAYRSLGLTWDQFCKEKVGITRPVVDKVIRQLEEFGPAFFQLASILRITADEYRLIAGSMAEDSVVYEGETIAINVENISRLAQAVDALRSQAAPPAPKSESPQDGELDDESLEDEDGELDGELPEDWEPALEPVACANPEFARVEKMLFSAIDKLTRMSEAKLDEGRRYAIQACVMLARDQLEMIALATNR